MQQAGSERRGGLVLELGALCELFELQLGVGVGNASLQGAENKLSQEGKRAGRAGRAGRWERGLGGLGGLGGGGGVGGDGGKEGRSS